MSANNQLTTYAGEEKISITFDFSERVEITNGQTVVDAQIETDAGLVEEASFEDTGEVTFLITTLIAGRYQLLVAVELSQGTKLIETATLVVLPTVLG